MSARLGWGLVGCGWVARDYVAPALRASANGRLVAFCDPSTAARAGVAGPDASGYATLQQLLAARAVQAVYVATPNHLHADQVEACARAGKHVLCEKPMATNAGDARRMVEACRAAGVNYATAFDQRFHAAHRQLARLVARGVLGVVTQARVHYACWLPGDWAADNWRVDPKRAGGGATIDLAPHGIDLLETILGDRWDSLTAIQQRHVHDYPVDDGAVLAGRFASGALGVLQVAYNCPDAYPRRTLEIIGTRARALATNTMGQAPGGRLTLTDAATGADTDVPLEDDRSPFLVQAEAFADAALNGRQYLFAGEDDLRKFMLLEDACAPPATR